MLQARLFSYADTHRHRLGVNYQQIPVNCPFATKINNYQRDGVMNIVGNQGGAPNYFPNSFDAMEVDQTYKEPPMPIDSHFADWYERNCEGDDRYLLLTMLGEGGPYSINLF